MTGDSMTNDSIVSAEVIGLGAINVDQLYLVDCILTDGESPVRHFTLAPGGSAANTVYGLAKLGIQSGFIGAVADDEARLAARTIASSPLVKAAIHGNDPNWGRIVAALGRSGAQVIESKLDLYLNNICVISQGSPVSFDKDAARVSLDNKEVLLKLSLNLGGGSATSWGCDLSEEYVTINSAYTT